MKTKAFFSFSLLVALLLTSSCTQTATSYLIEGTLEDSIYDGQMVYIRTWDTNTFLDSALVENSKFKMEGTADSAAICHLVFKSGGFLTFVLENGKYTVTADYVIESENSLNCRYNEYRNQLKDVSAVADSVYSKINKENKPEDARQARANYYNYTYHPAVQAIEMSVFEANTNNVLGAYTLNNVIKQLSEEKLDSTLAKAGPVVLNSSHIQSALQKKEILRKTAEGMPFVDFTIETEPGTKVSLSDYVGKGNYVLVDFWASWCGPCRQETPVVKEVYEKYKNKGFEALGVAVWDKPEDTKKAIEELGITWPQIINAQQVATNLYGVDGIPHIILFAPDGTIVARNLRGDNLKNKVDEVMKNKKK